VLLTAALVTLALTTCGGSSKSTTTQTRTAISTSTTTTSAPTTTTTGGSPSVRTGPVRGTLSGQNHAPKMGKPWRYSARVTDAAGHPLSGTVDIEFVYGGQVVGHDTPPTHPIRNGRWQDTLKFPATAVGQPLTFRAVVHTSLGSITLDWPITVKS
jgi:hypothetical protein